MFRTIIVMSAVLASCVMLSQTALAGPHSSRMLNPQPLPPVSQQIDLDM